MDQPIKVSSPRDPSNAWWRGAVIYQIYPRSFADSNADGIGDLGGIIEHLEYVAGLGVEAVWISPFFKSPQKDFGYDIADYRDVDPLFGSLADFDRLLARAHELGLKVIIDQVLSHTSDEHAWFKESVASRDNDKADWYVWSDASPDGTPPNNWLSVFGGSAWEWSARRRQYFMHNFLSSQPDLNFHSVAVQDQVLADIKFWLDRGVDGFRFDACNFHFHDLKLRDNPAATTRDTRTVQASNPYGMQSHVYDKSRPENIAFLERISELLDAYGAASVGEVGDDNSLAVMAEYTSGRRLHMAYSFNLLTDEYSAGHIRRQVEDFEAQVAGDADGGWACWSAGNHDVARVFTRWGAQHASSAFTRMVMAMLLSLRGSVCWYQGDELALSEAEVPFEKMQDPYGIRFWPEFKGRDGCRTPMPWSRDLPHAGFSGAADVEPWLPVPAEHRARAVDASERDTGSPLHFMRSFLRWRRAQPALTSGSIRFLDAAEPVLAFVREPEAGKAGDTLLVMFNLGATPIWTDVREALSTEPLLGHELPGNQFGRHEPTRFFLPAHGVYFGKLDGSLLRD